MTSPNSISRRVFVLVAAALALLIATAMLLGRGQEPLAATPVAQPAGDAVAVFAAFSRARTSDDALGATDRETLANMPSQYGSDLDNTRRIATGAASRPVYLVPGKDTVCVTIPFRLDARAFGVNCASTAQALNGELSGSVRTTAGDLTVAQVVPDDVTSATLVSTDGTSRALTITDNVIVTRAQITDSIVTNSSTKGRTTTRVPGA